MAEKTNVFSVASVIGDASDMNKKSVVSLIRFFILNSIVVTLCTKHFSSSANACIGDSAPSNTVKSLDSRYKRSGMTRFLKHFSSSANDNVF